MSASGEKSVSRKQETAITNLLSHGTLKASAAASGVAESTLRRWLKEPSFQAAHKEAKRELLDGTINRLRLIGAAGVRALHDVAVDRKSPAGARVGAGKAIIELMLRAVEVQDLAERLDALEATMGKGDD
jgi:hypothetical protein